MENNLSIFVLLSMLQLGFDKVCWQLNKYFDRKTNFNWEKTKEYKRDIKKVKKKRSLPITKLSSSTKKDSNPKEQCLKDSNENP